MPNQPLCFVLMPFGTKPDPAGGPDIDFNQVYEGAIKPGIEDADMLPIRADEEKLGGIIHKAMFERLLVCDFAVADLTTSNANVMYELGVRHTARPRTTLTIYAASSPLPFDVRLLRTQPYRLAEKNRFDSESAAELRRAVTEHLRVLRVQAPDVGDSPLFQLVRGWDPQPLPLDAAESFRAEVAANEKVKQRLDLVQAGSREPQRRQQLARELAAIRDETLDGGSTDVGVLTELLLTHRALHDWTGMIRVHDAMPEDLRRQVPIRQQVAFAYNRRAEDTANAAAKAEAAGEAGAAARRAEAAADRAQALTMLETLEREQGPSSETSGLLGRIYKSQWQEEQAAGGPKVRQYLTQAVDAYVRGFETDWRDVYPGINAVTLLHVKGDPKALRQRDRLLPVVRFAAERRLEAPKPSYWDHATVLELAVLADDQEPAEEQFDQVITTWSETWQPETTAGNLKLILEAREQQGGQMEWLRAIIDDLDAAAGGPATADL
jgi:hypothetical protein